VRHRGTRWFLAAACALAVTLPTTCRLKAQLVVKFPTDCPDAAYPQPLDPTRPNLLVTDTSAGIDPSIEPRGVVTTTRAGDSAVHVVWREDPVVHNEPTGWSIQMREVTGIDGASTPSALGMGGARLISTPGLNAAGVSVATDGRSSIWITWQEFDAANHEY